MHNDNCRFARLLVVLSVSVLLAAPASAAPATGPASAEAELVRLEQAYANALIRRDVGFLRDYYAPDWRGGDWLGFASKSIIMRKLRDSSYSVKSMVLRDLKVRLIAGGTVAIVQGVDDEVTAMNGRDTSGSWNFTDVFERRGSRWVAVASHTSKLDR